MSEHILDQNAVINDSAERSEKGDARANGENVSIVTLGKNTLGFLKGKLYAFFNFLVDVSEEINKVRAENERYSRMRW